MHVHAEFNEPSDHRIDLRFRRSLLHDDYHG
jgi:hypothetical protein